MPRVLVNQNICEAIGKRLQLFSLSENFLQRPFLRIGADPEVMARMLYFSVAICHQTHHLFCEEPRLMGWDYMEYGFGKLALEYPEKLNPGHLASCSSDDVKEMLSGLFINNHLDKKCTLDNLDERTHLLQDAAQMLMNRYGSSMLRLLEETGNTLAGISGFYKRLQAASAFRDPLRKKSSFLLKLLTDCNLYEVNDPDNIAPVIDYHMQRVLLRCGALDIHDRKIYNSLVQRLPVKTDKEIRNASLEALKFIANAAGLNILKMNDIFWPLGRSCCLDDPLCISGTCSKKPCTLSVTMQIPAQHSCILSGVCKGEKDEKYRYLWQPIVQTHYY